MKIVVANLYQLGRKDGKFDINSKVEKLHANAKITEDYVNEFNESSVTSGRFYEIDVEATNKRNKVEEPVKVETKTNK